MKPPSRYFRYALFFAVPAVIAVALLGLSFLALSRAGETIDPITAAKIQLTEDVRYSSALFYRPRPYKIERAKLRQADVILLGSSRAMQFVADPWLVPAINAGGAMRDMESGEIFVNAVLERYRPKQVIIALDWWWLSKTRRPDNPDDASPETPLTLHEFLQPAAWLWNGVLTPRDLWTLLFSPESMKPGIGIPARFRDSGWDTFGHYDYGIGLARTSNSADVRFAATLEDVARKSKRNDRAPWHPISESYWQRLESLIRQLRDHGVEVVLLMPPVAAPLYDWLAAQPEPNIVNEVRRRLSTLPVPTYDFHDPRSVGTDPCEFVDGIHGGEVTFLRVIDAVAADPASRLGSEVDRTLIQRLITENAGRATLRRDQPDRPAEADFLGLGCQK